MRISIKKHYFRLVKRIIFTILIFIPLVVSAQIGGQNVYDFLNLTPSARVASLGGVNISTIDDDLSLAYENPALVNDSMHQRVSLSFSNYLAGINFGSASYSHTFDKIGSFYSGIQYVNYGKLQGADEFGNLTGKFSAGDFAWVIGFARGWKSFRYGANLKLINSTLASGYSSVGLALDLGGSYQSANKLFSAGIVLRNIGTQLSTYVSGAEKEPLPFQFILGLSNKLKYMPLRFSLTLTNLENPNLLFIDPNAPLELDLNGEPIEPANQTLDRIFRHAIFSTEFLLGKGFRLRAGYNHLRRQELRSENRAGFTGFSLGAGIRVKRFALDYGFSSYGFAGIFSVHQFSLLMNLQKT